jgi:nitrogenase-associated protein
MADVIFFEKPGCGGNARQKALLEQAGHRLTVHDLFAQSWTAASLRPFFGDHPVAEWFNRSAPAIKSGAIDPAAHDEDSAMAVLLADPKLIRRPLMQVGSRRECGFDVATVQAWIGLPEGTSPAVEGCQKHDGQPCRDSSGA